MRIIDYKYRYEALKKGEFLIGIYKERFFFGITRSYKDGRLLDYYDVFSAKEIDKDYIKYGLTDEIIDRQIELNKLRNEHNLNVSDEDYVQ